MSTVSSIACQLEAIGVNHHGLAKMEYDRADDQQEQHDRHCHA
jgi:hypothetical protein